MSFDQAVYSFQYSDGQPPTPTRTPTSPSFFLSTFETPKQDSKNNSQNSPSWGSSFANALSPSFKTPNFATFSPLTPTAQGPPAGRDVEAQIATHEQLAQASSQPDTSNLGQGFEPFDLSNFGQENVDPQDSLKASIDTNVSSAGSMQTPPPTSTSASRRKAQQAQLARLTKDGPTKASRRMSFPAALHHDQEPQNSLLEESPLSFPNLEFSPDGFSFPTSGPATAPAYPQHRLFWDPDQNTNPMSIDMAMDDNFNAFGITSQRFPDPFAPNDTSLPPFSTAATTTSLQQIVTQASQIPGFQASTMGSALNTTTQGSASRRSKGLSVDPSLLFSSPSRNLAMSNTAPFEEPKDETMLPYAHQVREAREDKEIKARKIKRKRPPELGESPAVTAATAALRDDSTNSSKSSPVVADSFFGALENGPPQLDGGLPSRKKMTPDNHYRKHAGSSSLSRRRSHRQISQLPAVSFKIDENGRAVAEPSFVKGSAMDIDSDSDSSDSSSGSDMIVLSRHNSQRRNKERARKARFADDIHSHSQKSSDASRVSGRPASRLQSTLSMHAGHAQVQFRPSQSSAAQDDDSEVSTVVDSDEDRGDAQSELKKLVRQGSFAKKAGSRASWSAVHQAGGPDRRFSYHGGSSRTGSAVKPFVTPSSQRFTEIHANSSPTTITDPNVTPGSSLSNDSTRCICGIADGNGQLMIQCESCRKWLHTNCVGLNRHELPDVYLCNFCTNTPRAMRGRGGSRAEGRQPPRTMFAPPSLGGPHSPLGYKSRG